MSLNIVPFGVHDGPNGANNLLLELYYTFQYLLDVPPLGNSVSIVRILAVKNPV